jgi:hypothetical protein
MTGSVCILDPHRTSPVLALLSSTAGVYLALRVKVGFSQGLKVYVWHCCAVASLLCRRLLLNSRVSMLKYVQVANVEQHVLLVSDERQLLEELEEFSIRSIHEPFG